MVKCTLTGYYHKLLPLPCLYYAYSDLAQCLPLLYGETPTVQWGPTELTVAKRLDGVMMGVEGVAEGTIDTLVA